MPHTHTAVGVQHTSIEEQIICSFIHLHVSIPPEVFFSYDTMQSHPPGHLHMIKPTHPNGNVTHTHAALLHAPLVV